MEPHESPQYCRNYRHPDTWVHNARGDKTYCTSNHDVSFEPITVSLQHARRRREPLKINKRFFSAWIVKLNNNDQLVVEGTLECGRRARTKPIAERLSPSKILSKFKHTYYLIGDMADSQYELPAFVRHRFHAGFPQDWEIVLGIWKSFVTSRLDAGIRSSHISEGLIVEKKLKLAIDGCADNQCFVECAQKVNRVDGETHPADRHMVSENVRGYCENGKENRIIVAKDMRRSIVDYESRDDRRSKTINDIKQLTGWTPFVVPDKTVKHCLVFRGTLLSSMGHAVDKNHVTDAVRRRLSARIIETVNREVYELIGDLRNTKRDVPKELVMWCRYGCPKEIHLFCEKWRILRSGDIKFQKRSAEGEMKTGQDQGALHTIRHDKSVNMAKTGKTHPWSMVQPEREKKKRKRIPMELNDNCTTSDTCVRTDTTSDEKPDTILASNSRDRSWPKIRRRSRNNPPQTPRRDTDIAEDENLKVIKQVRPSVTLEQKQGPSPLKKVPLLSYVYHRCAPETESILSDGV